MKLISIVRLLCLTARIAMLCSVRAENESDPPSANSASKSNTFNETADKLSLSLRDRAGVRGQGLRMNFRGVPLQSVLEYLSEAAGYAIVLDEGVRVDGTIEAFSSEPLTREEALGVLTSALKQKGYTAIVHERTLTIVNQEDARTRDLPVRSGSDPDSIPRTDRIVTQILPVLHAEATQLPDVLSPLLSKYVTMTVNESANALVITATLSEIRRMAEIVKAIDYSLTSKSSVKVFPLHHAEAKTLASLISEIFGSTSNSQSAPGGSQGTAANSPQFPLPSGEGRGEGAGAAIPPSVMAIGDENSNSLIIKATDSLLPSIRKMVRQLDVQVKESTSFRLFALKNADPSETADMLARLFPGDGGFEQNLQAGIQMRGAAAQQTAAGENEEYSRKTGQIIAVPDARTSSLIVNAGDSLMGKIANVISDLDSNPARKQKIKVYSLRNAAAQDVQEVLSGIFASNSGNSAGTQNGQASNPLRTRANQSQQSSGTSSFASAGGSGFGSSGTGASSGTQAR